MNAVASTSAQVQPRSRILVVEDDILIRMDITETLRADGFTVIEAGNADEAMKVMGTSAGVDLVLTDVNMPGSMNGLSLARWVRAYAPDVKIMVMSGERFSTDQAVMDAVFTKPLQASAVMEQIRHLLR